MSKLIPDSYYFIENLKVNIKKIPFGTTWKKDCCGFKKGDRYKADRLLSDNSGRVRGITIHNTGNSADAETYARATFNQNMNTARVHFFVDKNEAWQILEENEVGWHAGTGNYGSGNDDTIAIEIIMGDSVGEDNIRAEDNGALLTAHLMLKYGLGNANIYTHKHWTGKNCPAYILPHWKLFLATVEEKYSILANKSLLEKEESEKGPSEKGDFEGGTADITNPDKVSDGGAGGDLSVKNGNTEDIPMLDAELSEPDNTPDEYARVAIEKAVRNGILKGDEFGNLRLHSALSRQNLFVVLDRLGLLPN